MATTQHQPNIWAQMAYTPPRGPCSQKTSMVSSCACYRFMIHPLKAASSFDCDGCGHHASFHRMESKEEEEIARRWKAEEMAREVQQVEREEEQKRLQEIFEIVAPKRRRIEAVGAEMAVPEEVLEWVNGVEERKKESVGKKGSAIGAAVKGRKRKERD